MAVSTTSSLHFLSLTPKTPSLISSSSSINSLSFFPTSFTTSLSSSKLYNYKSALPLKVAVSSDFGVDEEDADAGEELEERSFSPDLKIFVGNLPFSCDSALLAGLFGRAGTVEMVEVLLYLVFLCFLA